MNYHPRTNSRIRFRKDYAITKDGKKITRLGRPNARVDAEKLLKYKQRHSEASIRALAKKFRTSPATVCKVLKK